MTAGGLPFAANTTLLFTEHPPDERPAAAAAEGFGAIESWWPWPAEPVPGDAAVERFVRSVRDAGVQLIGLNFFGGDVAGPDAGVLSIPGRSSQFRDNIDVAVGIGEQLGTQVFNALYGVRVDGVALEAQDELATESIVAAAAAAKRIGATVVIEPVSGPKPYPLRTAADAIAVVGRAEQAGAANVGLLADLYHLASNGDDLDAVARAYASQIAHVQIADVPGRGEPGSGQLDLDGALATLEGVGYHGWVSLEYHPTVPTPRSLDWLPRDRRAAPGRF
jgi:hydroxypyruvate isomerase